MPVTEQSPRQPTDDWQPLRLLVTSSEQATYELLRPLVLFGQPVRARARETGVPERTLRRKASRFAASGMRSLFETDDPPTPDRRALPLGICKAIIELKAEYPPLSLRQIAVICEHRFDRAVSHHTVKRVLATAPLPLHPPRRLPRYRDLADPVQRRKAIVDLYLEGWSVTNIAGYLETTRTRVYETLARWEAEGWPGLADRPRGPRHPARKVDLKAMIDLSPRTCRRILALHRALGAPHPTTSISHEPEAMPFAARRRHQYWSVDVRYLEEHGLGTGKPVYVISILENFSRALLATVIAPRQDLTAYLIVLRAAVEAHGAPETLVSDSGSIFKANHARAIYAALGIEKREIDRGQAWQNYIETHFNVMRRMADDHYARAATWGELQAIHDRFFTDYNQQPHAAHGDRPKGRRSPASVLGWLQGAWCDPDDLDRLFRLRATRVLNTGGYVRFRHWRLYGERGLVGERAAVWVNEATLTLEYATDTLAQYRVTYESDGRRLREVAEPRLFATDHASPQPFLPDVAEVEWRPAQRLAPCRPRRPRRGDGKQAPLVVPEPAAQTG
jgi:putative transposase